jgi:predicted GTPase
LRQALGVVAPHSAANNKQRLRKTAVVERLNAKDSMQKTQCKRNDDEIRRATRKVSSTRRFVLWLVGGSSHNVSMNE